MQLPSSRPTTTLTQPRLILYYQTHNKPSLEHLLKPKPLVTHIILAALHLNHPSGNIHLNDHPPSHKIHRETWAEIHEAQSLGVKVLVLLGGAAPGSFTRLDSDAATFESYYIPLRDFLRWSKLDGIDLDVEEVTSLAGIIRLVLRLRQDFGSQFLITAAPVASALLEIPGPPVDFEKGRRKDENDEERMKRVRVGNMSGFSYIDLEKAVGKEIAWYNAQFYCGWGSMNDGGDMYRGILERGAWDPRKIVVGTVTNPWNGAGWTSERLMKRTFKNIAVAVRAAGAKSGGGTLFGGCMGWEYFNSVVARDDRGFNLSQDEPWLWAKRMRGFMDAMTHGNMNVLEPTWDEEVASWTGRFGETGFGGRSMRSQDSKGRWRGI